MTESTKTPGQIGYEEDCRRMPVYPAMWGLPEKPRPKWDELSDWARESWKTGSR